MNAEQFKELCDGTRRRQDDILFSKGIEYTQGAEDRGANFKRLAESLGVDPLLVWAVYFGKHVDAIYSYVKFGEVKSGEAIEGRFDDAMNYLLLGLMLVVERKAGVGIEGQSVLPPIILSQRFPRDGHWHCCDESCSLMWIDEDSALEHEQATGHIVARAFCTGGKYKHRRPGENTYMEDVFKSRECLLPAKIFAGGILPSWRMLQIQAIQNAVEQSFSELDS